MDVGKLVERIVFELSRVVFVYKKTIANCLLQLGNYRYCRYGRYTFVFRSGLTRILPSLSGYVQYT